MIAPKLHVEWRSDNLSCNWDLFVWKVTDSAFLFLEFFCSLIPTLPDNTAQLSTCPVLKSSMSSGTYMILILGNNGNGQPYAWQRGMFDHPHPFDNMLTLHL